MTKDEAIIEFFKGLRVAFNNALAYRKEHPFFVKSAANFKESIDDLFAFISPIKIGVTQKSLFLDERFWENLSLYAEIASLLHIRKIKSIEFRSGLSVDELVDFLSTISMPKKEVMRLGGVQNILNPAKYPHLTIEELDYSSLLKDGGEEVADIWIYFFKSAVAEADTGKINEFADNFGDVIKKFRVTDLLVDDEFRGSLYNFISYLKDKEKERYLNCNKELLKWVMQDKNVLQDKNLDKIKLFFKDLGDEDFVNVLEEQILNNASFDYLSFAVFSRLIEEHRNKDISVTLEDRMRNSEALKTSHNLRKRIREIFTSADTAAIPSLYRHALFSLAKDIPHEDVFSLDAVSLRDNYRYILLNLLILERDGKRLNNICERIIQECDKAIAERNWSFLKIFWQALEEKLKEEQRPPLLFEDLERKIANFVEEEVIDGSLAEDPEKEFLLENLKMTLLNADDYLRKIFSEGRINSYLLQLFFRFFPDHFQEFLNALETKHADIEFLSRLMMSLERVDESFSRGILKTIFRSSNNVIKIEVLRTYRRLSIRDFDFLFSILRGREIFLKKEIISLFIGEGDAEKKALGILFSIPSPFGMNNRRLIEHIALVEDAKLTQAKEWLINLSNRPFLWNRKLRKRCAQALGKSI